MSSRKRPVTVEDLLKVKRAERPAVEFWAEFERELRVKQLAAIVEPRPWWAPFIRVGARVSRYQLPLGAAAIMALTFVTVGEYRAFDSRAGSADEAAVPIARSQLAAPELAEQPTRSALPVATSMTLAVKETEVSADAAVTPAPTGQMPHVVAMEEAKAVQAELSPSALYIAANLAAVQADNPQLLDEAFGAVARRADIREPVRDPLTQIGAPGESRRSRLLATALPAVATSNDVAVGNSQRVARRLTEERLYDSISRVGVQGDRVAFKF